MIQKPWATPPPRAAPAPSRPYAPGLAVQKSQQVIYSSSVRMFRQIAFVWLSAYFAAVPTFYIRRAETNWAAGLACGALSR